MQKRIKKHFFVLLSIFFINLFFSQILIAESENNVIEILSKDYVSISNLEQIFEILNFDYNPVLEQIKIINLKNNTLTIDLKANIAISGFKVYNNNQDLLLIEDNKISLNIKLIKEFYKVFFYPEKNFATVIDKFFSNDFKIKKETDISSISNKELQKNEKIESSEINKNYNKNIENYLNKARKEIIEFRRIKYIIIDPGHGGKDPGAIYFNKKEKDINLVLAKALYKSIKNYFTGIKVLMTRSSDTYISLEDRVKFANKYDTQFYTALFISIHCNASPYSKKTNGLEIYYLDYNLVNEKIKNLVIYENRDALKSNISFIVNRLLNEELIYESKKLAYYIMREYKKMDSPIPGKTIAGAPFYVLAYTSIPSILIEAGYLSNKNDVKNLISKKFINIFIYSIKKGLERFIYEYNKTKGFKKFK